MVRPHLGREEGGGCGTDPPPPESPFSFVFEPLSMTFFPFLKDDLPRHEDKGTIHADDHRFREFVPSASRLGCLRSRSHDRRRLRYGRVVLSVLQLA